MAFSDRLKHERELRGWSQAKLAEMLGVTPGRVSTWERALSFPSPYVRQQLFTLLNKNASELELLSDDPARSSENDGLVDSFMDQTRKIVPGSSNRQRLLTKVYTFWIKDVLEPSLYGASLITPGLHELPHAVEYPWQESLQQSSKIARLWPPGTRITHIYEEAGNELLLLGEPGSGKTTFLLELARYLLECATKSENHPIPVVFHLASWAEKRLPFTSWLVEELEHKYQVRRTLGSTWIQTDQILPLLDGLDEVAGEHRLACVEAINAYRKEHGLVPMVVCSRSDDYFLLKKRLLLHRAVLLEPLTREQIDTYLLSLGQQAEMVRQVLQDDAALHTLAATPLMLSILAKIYHKQTIRSPLTVNTPQDQREQVFADYVQHMLTRRGLSSRYTKQQTLHWLSWLAKQAKQHYQSEISIERLQPDWLPTDRWQRTYYALMRCIAGLFFGLVNGLVLGMLLQWVREDLLSLQFFGWMLVLSLVSGLLLGLASKQDEKVEEVSEKQPQRVNWRRSLNASGIFFAVFGGGSALLLSMQLMQQHEWPTGWIAVLFGSLLCGFLSALISGILVVSGLIRVLDGLIQPIETIIWSWTNMKRSLPDSLRKGLFLGLLPSLPVSLMIGSITGALNGFITLLSIEIIMGGVGGLLFGASAGFAKDLLPLHDLLKPNAGIKRSLRYSLFFGGSAAVLLSSSIWFIVIVISALTAMLGLANTRQDSTWFVSFVIQPLSFAVLPGLLAGLVGGFLNGGQVALQHAILRLLLWRSGFAPLDYPYFLDYAVERLLLRRAGGGYIFIHPLVLDYFANLEQQSSSKSIIANSDLSRTR